MKSIETPRGRDVAEIREYGLFLYHFVYDHDDAKHVIEFSREYPLQPNLIDAVIDNHQIKRHKGILAPNWSWLS